MDEFLVAFVLVLAVTAVVVPLLIGGVVLLALLYALLVVLTWPHFWRGFRDGKRKAENSNPTP